MRRIVFVLLCLVTSVALAQRDYTAPLDRERTDVWFDPNDQGWSLTIVPSGEVSSALLADFDAAGDPRWWFGGAVRSAPGEVSVNLYRPRWNVTEQRMGSPLRAGTLSFKRLDEDHARVAMVLDGRTRTHNLIRFVVSHDYSLGDRSGFWFDPLDGGHGQMLIQQGTWIGSVSVGYDRGGESTWAFAQGQMPTGVLQAKRVRRVCDPGCRLIFSAGGETSIQFRDQADAVASVTLSDAQGVFWSRPQKPLHRYTEAPSARSHPAALAHFSGAEAFEHYRAKAALSSSVLLNGCFDFSPALPAGAAVGSDTNVQEAGVGEYDRVKRFGDLAISLSRTYGITASLNVHRLNAASGQAMAVNALSLPFGQEPIGLHLLPQGNSATLVAIYGHWPFAGSNDWCGGIPADADVVAAIYDLGADGSLQERHRVELKGSFSTSRLIGTQMLLATQFDVATTGAGGPLPQWRIDGGAWQPMTDANRVWLPSFAPTEYESNLVTVSSFDLAALTAPPRQISVFARGNASYVSPKSWYLVSSEHRYFAGALWQIGTPELHLHKIALPDLSYRGSGTIDGSIPSNPSQQSFRFSESGDDLRVLSDQYLWPNTTSLFRLDVLREAGDARLAVVATLPNKQRPEPIGPPHEQPYGVRFIGDVAYAVSYYRTDPLYAIDLSNPLDPKIDSALEVAGYSAYLHPLAGGHLLGFGRDALMVPGTNGDAPGFAWFQGLKFSVFDQRDRQHPQETWRRIVGGRGSDAELLRDHRALAAMTLPNGTQRIAVPVSVHDGMSTLEPWVSLPWVQSGIALLDIAQNGAVSAFRVQSAVMPGMGSESTEGRAVLYGDSVFLFNGGRWYGQRADSDAPMLPSN